LKIESYYHNCSPDYIYSIDPSLQIEIASVINQLPKRRTQSEIDSDLFWLLSSVGWSFNSTPRGVGSSFPIDLNLKKSQSWPRKVYIRELCRASTTLKTRWYADFAKIFGSKRVQIEAQFGKVEVIFKDFCGFRIAYAERRLALGIEMVLSEPTSYFSHKKGSIRGMASFSVAKELLTIIGLQCPIWLIGVKE
jgi:hypothetical protein